MPDTEERFFEHHPESRANMVLTEDHPESRANMVLKDHHPENQAKVVSKEDHLEGQVKVVIIKNAEGLISFFSWVQSGRRPQDDGQDQFLCHPAGRSRECHQVPWSRHGQQEL